MIWVDKYKPKSSNDCIGQNKNIIRIKSWLKTYDPSKSRPLFIYGPPGIGKTTSAHLCCKELGYNVIEFNASDQRNKNIIQEKISTVLSNSGLDLFGRASEVKNAVILDEIDGMAGNEDRGGIAQILIEIKKTLKPIIFICNDGQHQKLRSLKDKCEVIEFRKPDFESVRSVISKIAREEKFSIKDSCMRNLAESSNYDIRQIVNSLSLFKDSSSDTISKTTKLNPFEATKKALSERNLSLDERMDCFFTDYSIMPLFMFENYVKNSSNNIRDVSKAIDSFCLSDLMDKEIRSNQNWSLLNVQGLLSTAIPSKLVASGTFSRVDFPQFLGKLSNTNKRIRLTSELNSHMCLTLRGGLNADYLEIMRERLSYPLIKQGTQGIDTVIEFMHHYSLLRDDFNSVMELASWSNKPDPMSKIDTKTKTAFTLAYKKQAIAMPYFTDDGKAPKRKKVNLFGDGMDESEEEEEDDDVDMPIKPKKISKKPPSKAAAKPPPKQVKEEKEEKPMKSNRKQNGKPENGKQTNGNKGSQSSQSTSSMSNEESEKIPASKADKRPPTDGGISKFFIATKKPKPN